MKLCADPVRKGRIGVLKMFERLQPLCMEGGSVRGDFQALVLRIEGSEQVSHLFDEFGLMLGDFRQVNLLLEGPRRCAGSPESARLGGLSSGDSVPQRLP